MSTSIRYSGRNNFKYNNIENMLTNGKKRNTLFTHIKKKYPNALTKQILTEIDRASDYTILVLLPLGAK